MPTPTDCGARTRGHWQASSERRRVSRPTTPVQVRWKQAWPGALALVVFVALLARTVGQLARAPELNWDMLPAMALALEWQERDPVELHRQTYALARAELGPEVMRKLTGTAVTQARAQDPAAFHEHLAFYRSRVLYTLAISLLHGLGAPLSAATYWIPVACFALSAGLFLAWAARHLSLALAAVFALGLAHTPALLNQAGMSTADGLATLLTCLGAFVWLERRRFAPAAGLWTLAIAARPDGVILVGFLAAAMFLGQPRAERPSLRALGLWLAASAGLHLGLARFAGEYGWWPLMQISFVEKAVHPAELATSVDWQQYGAILARQARALPGEGYVSTPAGEVTGSTLVFLYAAVAVLGLARAWPAARGRRRTAVLLGALLATYLLRFFLFPQLWDRFFAPFYALVPLCLLAELRVPREPPPDVA